MDRPGPGTEWLAREVGRRVREWLEDMRRGPVQQWLDSCPNQSDSTVDNLQQRNKPDNLNDEAKQCDELMENKDVAKELKEKCKGIRSNDEKIKRKSLDCELHTSTPICSPADRKLTRDHSIQSEGHRPNKKNPLIRDFSLQSDGSGSSAGSVWGVLGARRVDAESLLLSIGFGPTSKQQDHVRIPDRFLAPSKLRGVSTEQFIREEQQSDRMHDCRVFGYRGLTGNPHAPPSTIVANIMERISSGDLADECSPLAATSPARPAPPAPPATTTTS